MPTTKKPAPMTPPQAPAAPVATASERVAADVSALLRARNPLLWIVTREEARVENTLAPAIADAGYTMLTWDVATGITDEAGTPFDPTTWSPVPTADGDKAKIIANNPDAVLGIIRDSRQRATWVLRDFAPFLGNVVTRRMVRSLARSLGSTPRSESRAMIILTPLSEVPPELAGHAIVVPWPMPDRAEIAAILDCSVAALDPGDVDPDADDKARAAHERAAGIYRDVTAALVNGAREAAIDGAVGLTGEEAASCYAKSLVMHRRIDPAAVSTEKKKVIARERVLEWYDPDPRGLDAIGGLDELKDWLTVRRAAFSQRARDFGLPAPKGVLLAGVPGCGKSLTAKAVATAWAMPLLRLDLGALKSKYVGESETNIRKALAVAETVSPCILWLDEIEKAVAGAITGSADGGVSADALGSILSWMQERKASVFLVATANDVSALPPELLRKGRFDELFFVDLPTLEERAAILNAALRAAGREGCKVNVAKVAAECADFTGAELAALVPEALFASFADGEREPTTADLLDVARRTVPLAQTAADKIERLRAWARGRARPASRPAIAAASAPAKKGRSLDL